MQKHRWAVLCFHLSLFRWVLAVHHGNPMSQSNHLWVFISVLSPLMSLTTWHLQCVSAEAKDMLSRCFPPPIYSMHVNFSGIQKSFLHEHRLKEKNRCVHRRAKLPERKNYLLIPLTWELDIKKHWASMASQLWSPVAAASACQLPKARTPRIKKLPTGICCCSEGTCAEKL